MWNRVYTKIYRDIKEEDVWRLWTCVNLWPTWHEDLEYCKMKGAFAVGNYFKLKPKGGPEFKIEIIDIKEGEGFKEFTDCTKFFGAKMFDTHKMERTSEGLRLTNTLAVTGPLKFLWIKLVAKKVADTVPQEMDILAKLARGDHD